MANLTLASAVINAARNAIALTIGSTTIVTDPLHLTAGTTVTGLSITVDGQIAYIGTVAVPGASSNVLTLPLLSSVAAGQKVIVTATGSNLEDSAGAPLLLTNQSVNATFTTNALQTSLAAMFTADPTIAAVQAGTYGKVYFLGNGNFVVFDVGNQFPLIYFQATLAGTNNNGATALVKLLNWQKGGGVAGIPALPSSAFPWATPSQVSALFTADPLIALLQSGAYGQVLPSNFGSLTSFVVYNVDNITPLVNVQATVAYPAGTFQSLNGYQQAAGVALAPLSQSQVTPGVTGTVISTGAASSGQFTPTVSIASVVTTATSATLTSANLTTGNGIAVGQQVYGPGIPAGAFIISMISGTSITLNVPVTTSGSITLVAGATIYTPTKYITVTAASNNAGIVWINTAPAYSTTGIRLAAGQTGSLPVGQPLFAWTSDFTNANDYVTFQSL